MKYLASLILLLSASASAEQAPGAPGKIGTWARPDKEAYGTTRGMPLWFSIARGAVAEIAYPHVDQIQTRDSFLMIRLGSALLDERDAELKTISRVAGTLAYAMELRATDGTVIRKHVYAHPAATALLVDYDVEFPLEAERAVFFVHNPAAERTAGGDSVRVARGERGEPVLLAEQLDVRFDEPASVQARAAQSVAWTLTGSTASVGFEGASDPETLLQKGAELPRYAAADYGNVAGALDYTTKERQLRFRVVIGLGPKELGERARIALSERWLTADRDALHRQQRAEWKRYLSGLTIDASDPVAEASVLVLKAFEDKAHRGAIVAGAANPALPWRLEAEEHDYEKSRLRQGDSNGGYRRVWPRDLFHIALSLHAAGDKETPQDVADWLRLHQKKSGRSGTWAQNMWVDGTPSWDAYQADETALPIVLVARLVADGAVPYAPYREMVLRAADAILLHGPGTDQERWEEIGGLSANTLAALVEGLAAAAWLENGFKARVFGERYLMAARDWARNLKAWLLIPRGYWGERYFARIELGGDGWNPAEHRWYAIANKAPGMETNFPEDRILDGGFLQWILAGLVSPKDEDFGRSIALYDRHVRKSTPWGLGYLRYNEDSYGFELAGGAWPILSAERALAAIERGEDPLPERGFLRSSANGANMLGEQDTPATRPLAWTHASYLILERSLRESKSFYRNEAVIGHLRRKLK